MVIKYVLYNEMKSKQTIRRLKAWNGNMRNKIIGLRRASKIYAVLGYLNKIIIAVISVILISFNSYSLIEQYSSIMITIIVLQVFLAVVTSIEAALNPSKLSKQCSICWKQYLELSRELSIVIDDLFNEMEEQGEILSQERYTNLGLLYSTKEQLILNDEPMIFFSNAPKTAVDLHHVI